MAKKFPIVPVNPQRICWGCDRYCAADAMACGNGSVRTPHPSELFGEDWNSWGLPGNDAEAAATAPVAPAPETVEAATGNSAACEGNA
ncbi:DUF3079 domain-containing protein [Roseateles sp.]|uniref:DUF3079 domain-containing protein n=1 Tax=Roseateles sp. TaxID=1971397 RepID=UPI003263C884